MSLSKISLYIWFVAGLLALGRGLHLVILPAFWDRESRWLRWEAAALVVLGVVMLVVAKLLFFKLAPKK